MSSMKDKEEVTYIPYDPKIDFGKIEFLSCVVPIVNESKRFPDNLVGTSFLLNYDKVSFVVTAKHVLTDLENPIIQFTGKNEQNITVGTKAFNNYGIDWIKHPNLDIAILPSLLPTSVSKKITNHYIIQKNIIDISIIQEGTKIKHIGFGEKKIGYYEKSKKPFILKGTALGLFEEIKNGKIVVKSPARFGDSGSPLFLKTPTGGGLIGVVTNADTIVKVTNKNDGEYTGKTTAIPINHVFEIINSEKMKKMISFAKKKILLENKSLNN